MLNMKRHNGEYREVGGVHGVMPKTKGVLGC